jgi:hypothetical protein
MAMSDRDEQNDLAQNAMASHRENQREGKKATGVNHADEDQHLRNSIEEFSPVELTGEYMNHLRAFKELAVDPTAPAEALLPGPWQGTASQQSYKQRFPVLYPAALDLEVNGNKVSGQFRLPACALNESTMLAEASPAHADAEPMPRVRFQLSGRVLSTSPLQVMLYWQSPLRKGTQQDDIGQLTGTLWLHLHETDDDDMLYGEYRIFYPRRDCSNNVLCGTVRLQWSCPAQKEPLTGMARDRSRTPQFDSAPEGYSSNQSIRPATIMATGDEEIDEETEYLCSMKAAHLPAFTHLGSQPHEEPYLGSCHALQKAITGSNTIALDSMIPDIFSNIRSEDLAPLWGLCWHAWCKSTLDMRITLGALLSVMRGLNPQIEVLEGSFF